MNNTSKSSSKIWDKLGVCASGFCLIHCIAMPIILIFFPSSKFFAIDEDAHIHIHNYIAIAVIISILMAVYPQCRKHGHKDILFYAIAGIVLVLAPLFFHHSFGEYGEYTVTITGSILLIIAHIKNMKVRHGKCSGESHSH